MTRVWGKNGERIVPLEGWRWPHGPGWIETTGAGGASGDAMTTWLNVIGWLCLAAAVAAVPAA